MSIINVIIAVFAKNLICPGAILADILADILDLEVTCILNILFGGFNGPGMVKKYI